MEFFSQLRQLAKTVEKDVPDIQKKMTSTPNYQLREEDKEQCVGNAILVARNLQDDVKNMKKEIRNCKKALQDDGGFLELAAISSALVKKQAEIVGQIEQHIQQYGYQPLNLQVHNPQENANNPSSSNTDLEENLEDRENTDQSNRICTENSEENNKDDIKTPEKKGSCNNEDEVKTPKLEDFGLSKDIMNYYRQLGVNMRKQINQGNQDGCTSANSFKEPHSVCGATLHVNSSDNVSTVCYQKTPVKRSDAFEEPYSTVPEYFNHAGLVPTPGFTGGRDRACSQDQDDSLPSETPLLLKSRSHTKPFQNIQQNGENDSSLDIPVPPVLNTPGIKQIEKYDRGKVKPLPALNLSESDTTDSPIPPVLQTPGIKQLSKSSDILIDKQNKPPPLAEKFEAFEDASPLPPVLCTPGVKQISKYWGKDKTVPDVISYDSDDDIPEMPELTYSWTDLQRIKTQYEKDSTINIQQKDNGGFVAQNTICKTVNEKKMLMPPSVSSFLNANLDDSPVPSMPELTGIYNFNRPQNIYTTQTDKENVAPQDSKSVAKNEEITYRLQHITQHEYDSQPDYVHRLLSLTTLNKTVNIMEKLFSQKLIEGKVMCVAESDLQPVLGPTTKSLLLVMIRLGRLKESYNKGQCHDLCYIPV